MAVSEKRLYQRYFVILHQGDKGYGVPGGKEPTGYAKIEVKSNNGRMTALFQNLKQIDNDRGFYKAYMVSKSGGSVTPIKIDLVQVDQWGKGNIEWKFNPADVGGSGLDIEKFNIVTLAYIPEPLDNDTSVCFPLVGHLKKDTNVQWKEEVIKQLAAIAGIIPGVLKQKSDQDSMEMPSGQVPDGSAEGSRDGTGREAEVEEKTLSSGEVDVPWSDYRPDAGQSWLQDTVEDDGDDDIRSAEDEGGDKSRYQDARGGGNDDGQGEVCPKVQSKENGDRGEGSDDTQGQEDGARSKASDDAQGREDGARSKAGDDAQAWGQIDPGGGDRYASWYAADKGQEDYPAYGYSFWDRMEWYYKRLFGSYMTVQPFDEGIKDVEWIRVDIQKDYNPTTSQNYFANQFYGFLANPYVHYIIGLQQENGKPKYIIYGMPGRYIKEEQPFGGQTGYVYWQPAKGQKSYPGAFGYWMAYIDILSGTIAFPKKPIYL